MTLEQLIAEIDAHSRKTGMSSPAIAREATGNPRLYQRLHRRVWQTQRDAKRIRAFIRKSNEQDAERAQPSASTPTDGAE